MSSQIDNILIQVRSQLQQNSIKLWLEPYYLEDLGTVEAEMERLARDFSASLSIPYDYCLAAINELQSNAIEKLRSRKEFQDTGVATLKVRAVRQPGGTNLITVNIRLSDTGLDLQRRVGEELKVNKDNVKVICSGKVVKPEMPIGEQGIGNNHQLMALILTNAADDASELKIYDRVRKTKEDAALLVNSNRESFLRMEDQDGNPIHLPPNEKKAIMMALALHEKGRSSLKRENYNEALILFLEADQEFAACNANILDTVDNYALLNLDIVWCYLCLKSLTQLPDAQRRLFICEENFRRTYGENMDRVMALKGTSENEKACVMRLHLLQAVLLFHQNRRSEARGILMLAESELRGLKIDETSLAALIDMGYSAAESRIALRSSGGNMERAVTFIIERRESKREARKRGKEEMALTNDLSTGTGGEWVNPRTLHTLIGMGFRKDLATVALRKTENDLTKAIDMLQHNTDALSLELSKEVNANEDLIDQIVKIGFDPQMARMALEQALNNSEQAVELLLKMQNDGNYDSILTTLIDNIGALNSNDNMPSTSNQAGSSTATAKETIKNKMKKELETLQAYDRFAEDVSNDDDEYLNLPLIQEENILLEYKRFLE